VGHSDGRGGLVDVLAAGATRSERVDAQVLLIDLDVNVLIPSYSGTSISALSPQVQTLSMSMSQIVLLKPLTFEKSVSKRKERRERDRERLCFTLLHGLGLLSVLSQK